MRRRRTPSRMATHKKRARARRFPRPHGPRDHRHRTFCRRLLLPSRSLLALDCLAPRVWPRAGQLRRATTPPPALPAPASPDFGALQAVNLCPSRPAGWGWWGRTAGARRVQGARCVPQLAGGAGAGGDGAGADLWGRARAGRAPLRQTHTLTQTSSRPANPANALSCRSRALFRAPAASAGPLPAMEPAAKKPRFPEKPVIGAAPAVAALLTADAALQPSPSPGAVQTCRVAAVVSPRAPASGSARWAAACAARRRPHAPRRAGPRR
jgi:hypothetical protein